LFAASGKHAGGSATTLVGAECTAASIGHRKTDGRFVFQTGDDDTEKPFDEHEED